MDEPNSKLKQSNSSESALAENQKKSSSRAGFRSLVKRGVYVERGPTKVSLANSVKLATQKEHAKAPRRQNKGQKRFLASVLNLLTKTSRATQVSDLMEMKPKLKKVLQYNPFEKTDATPNKYSQNLKEEKVTTTVKPEKTKRKYISKVVKKYREYDQEDNFEVIQPKKDIINTPSLVYSDTSKVEEKLETIKWSDFLPRLVQPGQSEINLEKERKLSHLIREVAEGRIEKENRGKTEVDEPTTLVASQHKKENGMYKFFVDLLETTFSVYSDKTKKDASPYIPSEKSSKLALEIDESVANKLNICTESVHDFPSPPVRDVQRIKNDREDQKQLNYFQMEPSFSRYPKQQKQHSPAIRKRMHSEFDKKPFTKYKNPANYSRSAENTQRKSSNKQSSKKTLMNLLKEQLSLDTYPFEEPQNLFEALKVMAKNKRRTRKMIRFDRFATIGDDHGNKRTVRTRKVASRSSRSKHKDDQLKFITSPTPPRVSNIVDRKRNFKPVSPRASTEYASKHSLEVFNINYDSPVKIKKTVSKKPKEVTLTYHSSNSEIEEDSKLYDPMLPVIQQIIMTVGTVCGEPESLHEFICLDDL